MTHIKRYFLTTCLMAALCLPAAGNGLNLNSLGSQALTMGGAFVGLADDFSAVFWNPAGAAFFESRVFGFYGVDLYPKATYQYILPTLIGDVTLVDAKSRSAHYLGGLAAYYHPVSDGLVVGLGVYTPSGLGSKWNGGDFSILTLGRTYEWSSKIGVVSISPLVSYRISEKIAVGAAFNINSGIFNAAMHAGQAEIPVPPYLFDLGQYDESMSGWGYGATLGFLVKPAETLSFGLTLRTASKVRFTGEAMISHLGLLGFSTTSEAERDITFPLWIAAGAAFRPVPKLLLTGDVQFSKWSVIDEIATTYKDPLWAALLAADGKDVMKMAWQDTTQFRFGLEYQWSPTFAVRGGYYFDPTPTPDTTMNFLIPGYDFNVLTLGFGYRLGDIQLDFGLEYLKGKDRRIDVLTWLLNSEYASATPGEYTMRIWVPNVSIGYRF